MRSTRDAHRMLTAAATRYAPTAVSATRRCGVSTAAPTASAGAPPRTTRSAPGTRPAGPWRRARRRRPTARSATYARCITTSDTPCASTTSTSAAVSATDRAASGEFRRPDGVAPAAPAAADGGRATSVARACCRRRSTPTDGVRSSAAGQSAKEASDRGESQQQQQQLPPRRGRRPGRLRPPPLPNRLAPSSKTGTARSRERSSHRRATSLPTSLRDESDADAKRFAVIRQMAAAATSATSLGTVQMH